MSSTNTSEEIASLDRVLDRLAATDESRLEAVLSRLLVPLVLKLTPGINSTLQAKVLSVLSHINKRIKDRTQIGLPVADLLEQLRIASPFTGNFLAIYVKMGCARLSPAALSTLLPTLLSFQSFPQHAQALVARAALLALPHVAQGGAVVQRFSSLFAMTSPEALSAVALLTQTMLYVAVTHGAKPIRGGSPAETAAALAAAAASAGLQVPPPTAQPGVSANIAALVGLDFEGAPATAELLLARRRGALVLMGTPDVMPLELALGPAVAGVLPDGY